MIRDVDNGWLIPESTYCVRRACNIDTVSFGRSFGFGLYFVTQSKARLLPNNNKTNTGPKDDTENPLPLRDVQLRSSPL